MVINSALANAPFTFGRRCVHDVVRLSYGFTGFAASTILYKKSYANYKNCKPVVCRHIVLSLHDPRTDWLMNKGHYFQNYINWQRRPSFNEHLIGT